MHTYQILLLNAWVIELGVLLDIFNFFFFYGQDVI